MNPHRLYSTVDIYAGPKDGNGVNYLPEILEALISYVESNENVLFLLGGYISGQR